MKIVKFIFIIFLLQFVTSPLFADQIQFPSPTGKFHIGTRAYHLPEGESLPHGMMVQFWYPSQVKRWSFVRQPVWTYDSKSLELVLANVLDEQPLNAVKELVSFAKPEAKVSIVGRFPLIIFSHGLGMDRKSATFICEELASHGFVVASPDHPDYASIVTYPNGYESHFKLMEFMRSDTDHQAEFQRNLLTLLTHLDPYQKTFGEADLSRIIDYDRIGLFGHSFGGGVTVKLIKENTKILTAISLDGLPSRASIESHFSQFERPFLLILGEGALKKRNSELNALSPFPGNPALSEMRADIKGNTEIQIVLAHGAQHFAFSDRIMGQFAIKSYLQAHPKSKPKLISEALEVLDVGAIDEFETAVTLRRIVLEHFAKYLLN